MAHEVEAMFSARQVPWHGIGKVTENALTAREAIVAGGLDWNVATKDIFVSLETTDKPVKIEGRKAVVRDSDNSVLGLVSDKYVPFQNADAFTFADNLIDSGEAIYETAGSLRHGKVIFLTAKLPEQILIGGEDAHDMYIVMRTSHDGTKAISVNVTPIRVVCMNTLTAAIKGARHKWSMQHTNTLEGKLQEARETLSLSFKYADAFKEFGESLMNVDIDADDFLDILEAVLPERPRTPEVIENIMDLYRESPTNGYEGTGWGAYNALTEYFDHGRETRSSEAVFSSVMDGHVASLRNEVSSRLLALA